VCELSFSFESMINTDVEA